MTPEQATFYRHIALLSFERESQTTRTVLAAVPTDKPDYRPDPNAKSAFELAWHIAAAENMFLDAVVTGNFVFGAQPPESVRTTADVASWYADRVSEQLQRIANMSGEDLARVVDFRGVLQIPAVLYLDLSMRHTSHHRGQLSTYLRPMGGKVPAIYGESYDSAQAKKAAQG
jgi:uncharacterized damage-inducible protein DinB